MKIIIKHKLDSVTYAVAELREMKDSACREYQLSRRLGASDEELAMACPMGLELTARITTNYLQLKTIYLQCRNHKLSEWKTFCDMIERLPFSHFITV